MILMIATAVANERYHIITLILNTTIHVYKEFLLGLGGLLHSPDHNFYETVE